MFSDKDITVPSRIEGNVQIDQDPRTRGIIDGSKETTEIVVSIRTTIDRGDDTMKTGDEIGIEEVL